MSGGPNDVTEPEPNGDAAEEEEEAIPPNLTWCQLIRIFIGKGLAAHFIHRRSKLRAWVCGSISAVFIALGNLMFKIHNVPPWGAILLFAFGLLWLVPCTWQTLVNNGSDGKFAYISSAIVLILVVTGIALAFRYEYLPHDLPEPPIISPNRVQLSDGTNLLGKSVSIFNPNDFEIYAITLSVETEEAAVSIHSVEIDPGEPADATNGLQRATGQIVTEGSLEYISTNPNHQCKLVWLRSLRPKQLRNIWIRGTIPSNSFVDLSVVNWTEQFPIIRYDTNGTWQWPLVPSNSAFWTQIGQKPMQLTVGVRGWAASNINTTVITHP